MCYAVRCPTCGKTTWAGCGLHIGAVKRSLPATLWCEGHPQGPSPATSTTQKSSRRKRSEE